MYVFEQQKSQSEEQLICDAIRKTFLGLTEINKIERGTFSFECINNRS